MSPHKGVPEGSSPVIPRLICRDPDAAADFYVSALGARDLGRRPGPDGRTVHALLTLSGGMIMVDAEWPAGHTRAPDRDDSSPVAIFAYVEDVDATVARAASYGARVLIEAANQFWGDRTAWIVDPAGHVWTLASRTEDTTEDQRQERWSGIVKEQTQVFE
ncbi:MAG TPA: VOC family protein [Gemmatimonadaceae bacterium]